MNIRSARSWHLWVSIILAIPMLIVGLTAVLIAHDKSLGLKEIQVAAGWLPGVQAERRERPELRSWFTAADGSQWLGTKYGLQRWRDGKLQAVAGLPRTEVRGLQQLADGSLIAATKSGLFRVRESGDAERLQRGEFWTLNRSADGGLLAIAKEQAPLISRDGLSWEHLAVAEQALAQLERQASTAAAPESISLGKLVMDLHTGKAFFGKQYEWIWIDVLGITLALLTFTGIWMWWRGQRRQVKALQAEVAALRSGGAQAA